VRASTRWWLLFGAGTATVLLAMGWITATTLALDEAERKARAEATYQEAVRLALWRMDSWLSPRLAQESVRPYYEYVPYFAQERAYTRLLNTIESGEVLAPSPLLTFESDYFPLHFQVAPDGTVSSPQVPEGNLRDLAESTLVAGDRIERKRRLLDAVAGLAAEGGLGPRVLQAEACVVMETAPVPLPLGPQREAATPDPQQQKQQQAQRSKLEWAARAQSAGQVTLGTKDLLNQLPQLDEDAVPALAVGPLVPVWLDRDGDEPRLLYARRVQLDGGELLQGVLVDWPRLGAALLEQVEELFVNARLEPVAIETLADDPAPTALATLPASFIAPRDDPAGARLGLTPLRTGLVLIWLVVLAAVAAAALVLRASITYGERRSRFASAVTHELRTPLTTFRMYSEMLAEGMIRDPEARQGYLETLRRESERLSTLVENVLAYSRLERGRAIADRQRVRAGDLLARLWPRLEQRAAGAGLELARRESVPPETEVEVDVEAVGQILLNLVDNACKYAAARPLELAARLENGHVLVEVRDHGPGVPADERAHIFRAFERGRTNGAAGASGIGLGLALSRGLARDLGGDLRLAESSDQGACFELSLPVAG
jgi:signal transduction histidine kinase